MGSKERIAKHKEKLYLEIISTAISMVRSEGRHALSLRRIAGRIEYSAPVIYSHFDNKEDLLTVLSNIGFHKLNTKIEVNCSVINDPIQKLISVLTTFWDFANEDRELYQLMYEVGTKINLFDNIPELTKFVNYLKTTLSDLYIGKTPSEELLISKCYMALALVHGLISANLFWKNIDPETNEFMLREMINSILNLAAQY